jgi:isopropylmalate/homocitrate/citramalate synthase
MGFGNPYGDEYNEEILLHWADEMVKKEIRILSLADTVGVATPAQIRFALETLIPRYPGNFYRRTPAFHPPKLAGKTDAALGHRVQTV